MAVLTTQVFASIAQAEYVIRALRARLLPLLYATAMLSVKASILTLPAPGEFLQPLLREPGPVVVVAPLLSGAPCAVSHPRMVGAVPTPGELAAAGIGARSRGGIRHP